MQDPLGVPARLQTFEPSHTAALQRLGAINPSTYARSRNALDGAVTGLSPYLTHGLISLPDATRAVHARQPLSFDDKLVFEFGWREFFHHVWGHQKNPDAILQDMHGEAPWRGKYADVLPLDIRQGCTGVPAIDNDANFVRHRLPAQPHAHVASKLRGALSQSALALRG